MTDIKFPHKTQALRIEHNLGTFYVAALPVKLLLKVAASHTMKAILDGKSGGYRLKGTQRARKDSRLRDIASYLERTDSVFPNSIILAANYNIEYGFDQDELDDLFYEENNMKRKDRSAAWTVEDSKGELSQEKYHILTIPSEERLAAIIDGQHRLFSFTKVHSDAVRDQKLLCSIFIDLPKAFQAQIFATINSTQKPVNRSLTYELFGFNTDDEEEEFWTPDKLAVFLTRKLATEKDSPLCGRITVAPKMDKYLEELSQTANWRVSTAVVADGILRLFSSNPKRDADAMRKITKKPRTQLNKERRRDKSPLRDTYIENNNALIYKMVLNYLKASEHIFWKNASEDSFIFRTVGVQAVFDILRKLASKSLIDSDISTDYFSRKLEGARAIDFSEDRYRNTSGSGRVIIRKAIEEAIQDN